MLTPVDGVTRTPSEGASEGASTTERERGSEASMADSTPKQQPPSIPRSSKKKSKGPPPVGKTSSKSKGGSPKKTSSKGKALYRAIEAGKKAWAKK